MLRTPAAYRRRAAVALASAAAAIGAAPADAAFTPIERPFADGVSITGFAVSGQRWVAADMVEDGHVRVSDDSGETWADATQPYGVRVRPGAAVAPDGAIWITGQINGPVMLRLPPGSTALEVVGLDLAAGNYDARYAAPAWDAAGRMWVAAYDNVASQVTLARVDGTGAVAEQATVPGTRARVAAVGGSVWLSVDDRLWRWNAGGLEDKGQVGLPVWADGRTILATRGLSLDGGSTFPGQGLWSEPAGNAELLLRGTAILRPENLVFAAIGDAPAGATALWRTSRGLLALTEERPGTWAPESVFALDSAVPDGWVESRGDVSAATLTQLRRVNELRADAGLPPMTADANVEAAAESHSRYWTLNTPDPSDPLSVHRQTVGAPGFTGVTPTDRCRAAGAPACGEVVYGGRSGKSAVDGWTVTPYHGALVFGARNFLLGAGEVDGAPTVTNFTSHSVVIAPVAYPRGRYDADRGFYGESPDPAVDCAAAGYRVSYPLGTAVTFVPPASFEVSDLDVFRDGEGAPLAGCLLLTSGRAQFIPDEPLAQNTAYRARAIWEPTPGMPEPYDWTFTTTAGDTWDYDRAGGSTTTTRPTPTPTQTPQPQTAAPGAPPPPPRAETPGTARLGPATLRFGARLRRGRIAVRGSVLPRSPRAQIRFLVRRGDKRAMLARRLTRTSTLETTLRVPRGRGRLSLAVAVQPVAGLHAGAVKPLHVR